VRSLITARTELQQRLQARRGELRGRPGELRVGGVQERGQRVAAREQQVGLQRAQRRLQRAAARHARQQRGRRARRRRRDVPRVCAVRIVLCAPSERQLTSGCRQSCCTQSPRMMTSLAK